MTWKILTFTGISIFTLLFSTGCTRDQVPMPEPCDEVRSYNEAIRDILRNKCNTSGCHDGASGVGNYNSYNGVSRVVEIGDFRQEVVVQRTMPKDGTLTDEEFKLLKCWVENGYPED